MSTKLALYLSIAITPLLATAQADDPNKKLDVFLGHWESQATSSDTSFSKAGKISSNIDCRRSPQAGFMICEQQITRDGAKSVQLSIFSYNAKKGSYTISGMAGPGAEPWNGTFIIEGSLWTYPNKFEKDGKKIQMRTTNDFSTPGTEIFKTEFSDDDGAHWTVMLQGTAHKTGS
jgi:hypothetical protein